MKKALFTTFFFIVLVLLQLVLGDIVNIIPLMKTMPVSLLMIIVQFISLLVPTFIYILITKQSIKKTIRFNKVDFKSIITVIGIAITVQPFALFISAISGFYFKNPVNEFIQKINYMPFYILLLMIAITPAICEEIVFRGVILSGYENLGKTKAVFLSGFLFGILHLNFQQFGYAFLLGVIFAYIIYITDSIITTMIAHFTINSSQLILQKIAMNSNNYLDNISRQPTIREKIIVVIGILILAIVFTPITILLINILKKINKKETLNN